MSDATHIPFGRELQNADKNVAPEPPPLRVVLLSKGRVSQLKRLLLLALALRPVLSAEREHSHL
jgi:hypothetical protein